MNRGILALWTVLAFSVGLNLYALHRISQVENYAIGEERLWSEGSEREEADRDLERRISEAERRLRELDRWDIGRP